MNDDLGFSPAVFGFGAGILFVGYALFQIPLNIVLERVGARRFVACITALWGALSASTAFVETPMQFYVLRFFLGVVEGGFFPGMIFYMTLWFPQAYRARLTAGFMSAIPVAFIIGGPLSSLLLGMDGIAGLRGWQWLFLLEGLPVIVLALLVLKLLPDRPSNASFLTADEKRVIASRLSTEDTSKSHDLWLALRDPRVFAVGLVLFGLLCAGYGIQLWLPQMVQATGFSARETGLVLVLPGAVAIVAMVLWGRSSDLSGDRVWHLTISMLVTAAAFGAAGLAQPNIFVLTALVVAFAGQLACLPIVNNLPGLFLRGRAAAGGIALYNSIGQLGGFAGPFVIGVLREETGGYGASMAAIAAVLLLTAFVALGLGRVIARHGAVSRLETSNPE